MSTKVDLTSADLDEIRQSALGAADPLGVAADLADAVESGRLADPQDAGKALILAAEIAESRVKLDAALRYAASAVAAGPDQAVTRALHARILYQLGRAEEAAAELEPLRARLTDEPDAAAYVTAALSAGGRLRDAETWLTEAVQAALSSRAKAPADAEDAGLLFFLLQQRHRTRHSLGLPHDGHDNLAERLETKLANATKSDASDDDLLFWPRPEFDRLAAQWPALAEAYGGSWDSHRAHLERALVRLAAAGRTGLTLLTGSADGLAGYAGDNDPADPKVRAGYAQQVAAMPGHLSWPPERNGPCWCGSGLKYKKCCLPRARG